MNRKQKRELKKGFKKNNNLASITAEMQMYYSKNVDLNEGDKVKLNYNRITSYPDYPNFRKESYIKFIEDNKNKIFTVQYDSFKKEYNDKTVKQLVQLAEDDSNPKFLFWSGDLIIVERVKKEKTELEKYMESIDQKIQELE